MSYAPQPPWSAAMLDLLDAVRAWTRAAIKRNRHSAWLGGHDEGSFTCSWFPYAQLTGDQEVIDFLRFLRDGFLDFADRTFRHGYYATGETHHQPEPFMIFLARLLQLDPADAAVAGALDRAAEHIGNWVDGAPDWYDWDGRRFRSWRIGAQRVDAQPPWDHEVPDHIRFAQIAILAYIATQRQRYLDFAVHYATKWAALILDSERIPGYLLHSDASLYPEDIQCRAAWPESANVELHVSAGTADTLLDLFEIVGEQRFADAARRLLEHALVGLADPYCQPVGAQLLKYRAATGDASLDAQAMEIISAMPEEFAPESSLLIIDDRSEPHPMGLGRRKDGVKWGYRQRGGGIVEEAAPSPASLMLAYRITGGHRYLVSALRKAATRLRLASRALTDGRQHGCAGATIGAVASGHGRACGIGNLTATLAPAAFGAYRFANADKLRVRYARPDGSMGLPDGVAALVEPDSVALYNSTDSEATVKVEPAGQERAMEVCVPAGVEVRVGLG